MPRFKGLPRFKNSAKWPGRASRFYPTGLGRAKHLPRRGFKVERGGFRPVLEGA